MSSAVNVFVHAIRKRLKNSLAQRVGNLGSFGPIPITQPPFNSYCVALQYEPETKNFHLGQGPSMTYLTVTMTLVRYYMDAILTGTFIKCY